MAWMKRTGSFFSVVIWLAACGDGTMTNIDPDAGQPLADAGGHGGDDGGVVAPPPEACGDDAGPATDDAGRTTDPSVVRLGLHYTEAELVLWRERMAAGPYRSSDDVSPGSPGDWERIETRAARFLANPADAFWTPAELPSWTGGCIPRDTSVTRQEPHGVADDLRDAAFVALVTEDSSNVGVIADAMLRQARESTTDFSDASIWCRGSDAVNDINPGFAIAEWVLQLVVAYDYVKGWLAADVRAELEAWFLEAGRYFRDVVDGNLEQMFDDREACELSDPDFAGESSSLTHRGGFAIPRIGRWLNNRRASMARLVAYVGVLVDDDALRHSGWLFARDWLTYGVFPDGTINEFYRGKPLFPEAGYSYVASSLFSVIMIADVFAREGDASLYRLEVMRGIDETIVPEGGTPKTLCRTVERFLDYMDGSVERYLPSAEGADSRYLIDGYDPVNGWDYVVDVWVAPAHWCDSGRLEEAYTRRAPGTRPYPSRPASAGPNHPWGGSGAPMPGLLFMFGETRELVNVYP